VDVRGLAPVENDKLLTAFWVWQRDAAPATLDVTFIAEELRAATAAILDGPQGLATKGQCLRVCERQSAAVGKTPDTRPELRKPFAGFICSSLDIFAALNQSNTHIARWRRRLL
jgi:hypothetical protein